MEGKFEGKRTEDPFDRFLEKFDSLQFLEPLRKIPKVKLKPMFGCLAIYRERRMILLICENTADKKWKDRIYEFAIWNGILVPTDRRHHLSLQKELKTLISHPVLGKWLYLSREKKSFRKDIQTILSWVFKKDPRLGVISKRKK